MKRVTHSKFVEILVQLMVATILIFNTGCSAVQFVSPQMPVTLIDGQIGLLQPGTTLYGLSRALISAPGALIWTDPNSKTLLFSWPVNDGVGWITIRNAVGGWTSVIRMADGKGNVANQATWDVLRGFLESGNWKVILPKAISPEVVADLNKYISTVVRTAEQVGPAVAPAVGAASSAAAETLSVLITPIVLPNSYLDWFQQSINGVIADPNPY
jgi:hypothetical protein